MNIVYNGDETSIDARQLTSYFAVYQISYIVYITPTRRAMYRSVIVYFIAIEQLLITRSITRKLSCGNHIKSIIILINCYAWSKFFSNGKSVTQHVCENFR